MHVNGKRQLVAETLGVNVKELREFLNDWERRNYIVDEDKLSVIIHSLGLRYEEFMQPYRERNFDKLFGALKTELEF